MFASSTDPFSLVHSIIWMIDALQGEENTFEEWTTKNVPLKWQIRFGVLGEKKIQKVTQIQKVTIIQGQIWKEMRVHFSPHWIELN